MTVIKKPNRSMVKMGLGKERMSHTISIIKKKGEMVIIGGFECWIYQLSMVTIQMGG